MLSGSTVLDPLAEAATEAREEERHELRDVRRPLAQRRELDGHHVEAIEEIRAEAAGRDRRVAGRGWSPRSRARRREAVWLPPTGSNSPSWSTRSSFTCVSSGSSPTSSRKIVPAVGELEAADPALERAGERALLVAEQLALHQAGRDRRAVDLHERSLAARALVVDGAGDQLLAGAGLAR